MQGLPNESPAVSHLYELVEKETDPKYQAMVASIAERYESSLEMTDRQAAIIFWRMKKAKIAFNPAEYIVTARNLRDLRPYQLKAIWPALSQTAQSVARSLLGNRYIDGCLK